MVRTKGENLRAIYVVLFLNVVFYFLEFQDPARYRMLFSFDRGLVAAGQLWRLLTYQFVQGSPLSFFFGLLILYIMGGSIEEELGTAHFLTICLLSTLATAGLGAILDAQLIGSFVFSFSLLFIFATLAPDHVFYVFLVVPMKVTWLAYIALGFLLFSAFGSSGSIAALGGAAVSYGYFLLISRIPFRRKIPAAFQPPKPIIETNYDVAHKNRTQYTKMKDALGSGSPERVEQLANSIAPNIVPGVNVCPPADFKPDHADGYCIRCEGFNECSVRYLKAKMPESNAPAT
jgi:membrane associated rhomboid family serine protease